MSTIHTSILLALCNFRNSLRVRKDPLLGVNHGLPPLQEADSAGLYKNKSQMPKCQGWKWRSGGQFYKRVEASHNKFTLISYSEKSLLKKYSSSMTTDDYKYIVICLIVALFKMSKKRDSISISNHRHQLNKLCIELKFGGRFNMMQQKNVKDLLLKILNEKNKYMMPYTIELNYGYMYMY